MPKFTPNKCPIIKPMITIVNMKDQRIIRCAYFYDAHECMCVPACVGEKTLAHKID